MTKKILFLHGFFASGQCHPAQTIKKYFNGKVEVLTPDLPLHPQTALTFISQLCETEHPDILVGNSNGAFLAQITATKKHLPALLGNPHFEMTRFLTDRIGEHTYKSPRLDKNQQFMIDQTLISEFDTLQQHQWDYCEPDCSERIWGVFGTNDTLAHYEPLFLKHYKHTYHFPGGHTPTAEETLQYYVPLIEQLLATY